MVDGSEKKSIEAVVSNPPNLTREDVPNESPQAENVKMVAVGVHECPVSGLLTGASRSVPALFFPLKQFLFIISTPYNL
jgi:hypothetical protein